MRRDHPFPSGSEAPLRFSDARRQRGALDWLERRMEQIREEIARLEGEARAETDPHRRAQMQCEAEAFRRALERN